MHRAPAITEPPRPPAGAAGASFRLRRATDADVAAAGEVTVAAYVEDGLLDDGDDYVRHLGDAAARARDAELWVAVDEAGVLGTVTFCPVGSPFRELSVGEEGEFRMLAVAPRARRRGVAEALVRVCEERARELGLTALVLCSMREMSAAHRLYARLGFRRTPDLDWSPVEGVELIAYRLDLA